MISLIIQSNGLISLEHETASPSTNLLSIIYRKINEKENKRALPRYMSILTRFDIVYVTKNGAEVQHPFFLLSKPVRHNVKYQ